MVIEITAVKLDSPNPRKCWASTCGDKAEWFVYSKTKDKDIICKINACRSCLSSAMLLALQGYSPSVKYFEK